MKSYVFLIAGLVLMAPAAAQTSDTNSTTGDRPATQSGGNSDNAESANDPNRRICRRVETNTGSRVPFRTVCLTERQWRDYRPN